MTAAAATVVVTITQLAAAATDPSGLRTVARRADARYHPWRERPACAMAHTRDGSARDTGSAPNHARSPGRGWNAIRRHIDVMSSMVNLPATEVLVACA